MIQRGIMPQKGLIQAIKNGGLPTTYFEYGLNNTKTSNWGITYADAPLTLESNGITEIITKYPYINKNDYGNNDIEFSGKITRLVFDSTKSPIIPSLAFRYYGYEPENHLKSLYIDASAADSFYMTDYSNTFPELLTLTLIGVDYKIVLQNNPAPQLTSLTLSNCGFLQRSANEATINANYLPTTNGIIYWLANKSDTYWDDFAAAAKKRGWTIKTK